MVANFDGGLTTTSGQLTIETDNAFKNKMFRGVFGNQAGRFDNLTPYITGRTIFIPTRMPKFMEDKSVYQTQTAIFKKLLMYYVKAITGFSDRQVGTVEIDTGIENTKTELPSSQTAATRELSFQFGPELTGQFISKYTRLWIDGVIDPLTHDATYHGSTLTYQQTNHTMEGLYIVLDPTRKKVQFHAYLSNMFPKSAPGSLNDGTVGDHNIFEPQIPFTVTAFENIPAVGAFIEANFNFGALAMTSTSSDATTLAVGTTDAAFIQADADYLGTYQKKK